MDTAVALVNAYLQINGYLCVTEYPLLETGTGDHVRNVSDLDILAFRFPHAGRELALGSGKTMIGDTRFAPDPALGGSVDKPDMIVGEVKRAQARFNTAIRRPEVLAAALMRFGCCSGTEALSLARRLVEGGRAHTAGGHEIRMVAFGGIKPDKSTRGWQVVPLETVIHGLRQHFSEQWARLKPVQFGNPVLDLLALLERVEPQDQPPPSGSRRKRKENPS